MSNLFISHSSRDNVAAKELQARLEKQGHRSVFLDLDPETGIQAGVSWERTLYTKLRACRAVVALCSDSYLASQWCFAEIALARMEGKEVFVLQIDPWSEQTQMPSILTEEQYIDLRTNKNDGYQRLWNGFKVKGIVAAEAREWRPEEPPYPGLRAFREKDAPIFFGRDEEIREGGELLNRVRRQGHPRLVMVLGSSGSGKSSLVRAGIVPQLRRDRGQWLVVKPFRPGGRQPARELAASLSQAFDEAGQAFTWEEIHRWLEPVTGDPAAPAPELPATVEEAEPGPAASRERLLQALRAMEGELTAADDQVLSSVRRLKDYLSRQQTETPLPSGGLPPPSVASPLAELAFRLRLQSGFAEATVVLVIDQFEELLGHDAEHPASRFLAMLRAAMELEDSPLLVIGTMRSDYLGVLQRSAPLQGLGFRSLSVGPMSRDGMRQIIEEPAKLGQIQLENGLSDLLLEDTETSDALPLLAFTLRMIWDRYRDERLLEIRAYRELGGLQGAVAQVADETLETALTLGEERDLRDAFLSLARPAAEGSGWARQATSWEDLAERVRPMFQQFIDRRLLVKRADGTVEVAHEALFRSWNRLKGWLDQNAEGLQLLREIQVDAEKWQKAATEEEKDPYLWRGGRLARALELRSGGVLALKDLDKSFVEASDRAEKVHQRRKRRVARLITGGSASVALIMAMLVLVMYNQWQEALRLESLFLGDAAERQLKKGDAVASMLLAHEGLQNPNARELRQRFRPYVREAEVSLNSALDSQREQAILAGHNNRVSTAEFSPDGTRIVTASLDMTARVWSATTGAPIAKLNHTGPVQSAAFSADGKHIVTASDDHTARVWDAVTGAPIAKLNHTGPVQSAAFSADGEHIVTASDDHTARVWDAVTGAPIAKLNHTGPVQSAAFSADGGRIVTTSDKTAQVWNAKTGVPVAELRGHTKALLSATFSPDGTRIVTASLDMTARVWNATTGALLAKLNHHTGPVQSAAFSADGGRIVTASDDHTARVWDAAAGKEVATLKGHQRRVRRATFSQEGTRIVTASDDETTQVWDAATGAWLVTLAGHTDWVWSAAFSPDGTRIVTTSDDQTARVWKAATGKILSGHKGIVRSASFSPDGMRIITTSDDDTARLWDAAIGKEVDIFSGQKDKVRSAAYSPDGVYIVTASNDKAVRVWDAATGKKVATFKGLTGQVRSAEFSADGTRIITASENQTVQVWDMTARAPLAILTGDKKAFSPDGMRVVTASNDHTARVWDAATGKEVATLKGHTGQVRSAAFSPDGARIVTGSRDNTARVWKATTGEVIHTLEGHTAWVNSAVFSPDGARIVTASGTEDQTVRVWDAVTGKAILPPLEGHTDWVNSAAFSPNGAHIVSRSEDKTVRVWDAATGELLTIFAGHPAGVRGIAFSPDSARIVTTSLDPAARVWDIEILDKQVLIDRTKKRVPRCLTKEQRKQYFLTPEPPQWCVELGKWPYGARKEK